MLMFPSNLPLFDESAIGKWTGQHATVVILVFVFTSSSRKSQRMRSRTELQDNFIRLISIRVPSHKAVACVAQLLLPRSIVTVSDSFYCHPLSTYGIVGYSNSSGEKKVPVNQKEVVQIKTHSFLSSAHSTGKQAQKAPLKNSRNCRSLFDVRISVTKSVDWGEFRISTLQTGKRMTPYIIFG